jgi:hypothetical protein
MTRWWGWFCWGKTECVISTVEVEKISPLASATAVFIEERTSSTFVSFLWILGPKSRRRISSSWQSSWILSHRKEGCFIADRHHWTRAASHKLFAHFVLFVSSHYKYIRCTNSSCNFTTLCSWTNWIFRAAVNTKHCELCGHCST